MDTLRFELAYALRRLLSSPGTTLIIILTLAFGIGANTAAFSVVNGVLFRNLPFARSQDVVEVRQQAPKAGFDNIGFSVQEIGDYRQQANAIEDLAEYHFMYFYLRDQTPALVRTGVTSANFFDFLGVKPPLGRGFVAADEQPSAEPVILLSHEFWMSHYSGSAKIVGTQVEMNNQLHRIIGVLPPFPQFPEVNDIYVLTSACPTRSSDAFISDRNSRMMSLYGRKKAGASFTAASNSVDVVSRRLQSEHPDFYPAQAGFKALALPLQDEITKGIRPSLYILSASTLLVLLIACANVVNISLAQQSKRQKEIAVRVALGADQYHLASRLVLEGLILSVAGGLLGLAVAYVSVDWLVGFASQFTTRAGGIAIDGMVLGFTFAVSLLCGVIVGLVPAFSKHDTTSALKESSSHATMSGPRQKIRQALIVLQVAGAFALVVAAGVMVRSFLSLRSVDPGFQSQGIVAASVPLNWSKYEDVSIRSFVTEVQSDLAALAEVKAVAYATAYPFGKGVGTERTLSRLVFEDRPQEQVDGKRIEIRSTSPNYFDLLKIDLLAGRVLADGDDEKAPRVMVISKAVADAYWPGRDPLNNRVSMDNGKTWWTVVGVVANTRQVALDTSSVGQAYIPFAQNPTTSVNLLLRTDASPAAVSAMVSRVVAGVDPEQPVYRTVSLATALDESIASPSMIAKLLSLFSGLALAISMIGISGLLAFSVSQRTRELGVRMALGATPEFVRGLVLKQGMLLIGLGLLVGLAASRALDQLLRSLVYGISPSDPVTYIVVSMLFLATAFAACWAPAYRASQLDPSAALRSS